MAYEPTSAEVEAAVDAFYGNQAEDEDVDMRRALIAAHNARQPTRDTPPHLAPPA